MCTLVIMRGTCPRYPLVVASNRDESDSRPSAPPAYWSDDPAIYAPVDLVRGGTWIGVSRRGLVTAITNRDGVTYRHGCRSRGRLVSEVLRQASAQEAMQFLKQLNSEDYNGFHLFVTDATSAWLAWGDGERLHVQAVPEGLHVVTGYGFNPGHAPRAEEIERRWQERYVNETPTVESLDQLLNFHGDGSPESAACVHAETESHKTRSSMIIRADQDWSGFDVWHREGRACAGPFNNPARITINK